MTLHGSGLNRAAAADPELADDDARAQIVARLESTLFVEAGAGSGKTSALVSRIAATVLDAGRPIPLRHIAAITFTEKAAAELRDRLRARFEYARGGAQPGSARARLAEEALEDLDEAAIGTVHAFARRILGEHPIEAGLPPLVEVLDEVASSVAFENRWTALRADLLDDPALASPLLLAMAAGLRLDDLRSIAKAFTSDWDLIAPRVLAQPPGDIPPVTIDDLLREARRLVGLARHCRDADDRFLDRLAALAEWADGFERAGDDPARLSALVAGTKLKWGRDGRATNWSGYRLDDLRSECAALARAAGELCERVGDAAVRHLARWLGEAMLAAAAARRAEGTLEFHDLLVLTRDLLCSPVHGASVRGALSQRYQRILLDEFQDTDPIQIALAVRIAGGVPADAPDWTDVAVPDGTLFVVGDPKQSIYRFRRADIGTYLLAQQEIGEDIVLSTNFRTGAPVLAWVNHTFGRLIRAEPDSQPAYRPLSAVRPAAPAGPAVMVLGAEPHGDKPSADDLRRREAADVVAAVQAAIAERWQVSDDAHRSGATTESWRDVRLSDIAVLVPARTSLPHLEAAFEAAGVPYRAEASSLVYRTREVRDLLTAARAVDDPSDALALVTALRSPLFGCGDDDLWTWHAAGGRWNLLAPAPDLDDGHPVADAIDCLRRLHNDRTWLAPSEVLARLVDERRMYEVAAGGTRSRDVWRRLRFVVDHARAWSEAEHGSLRDYLAWAALQGDEASRVAEAVLPETDADTVRIMTIHAAKGLEFPVVIVSGMSSQPGGGQRGVQVLWPRDGGYAIKLCSTLQTSDFEVAKPIDEQMGHHERLRLLYVACTRARDHLVVSLHRKARTSTAEAERLTSAELLADACDGAPGQVPLAASAADGSGAAGVAAAAAARIAPPPYLDAWRARMATVQARAAERAAVSASELEGLPDASPQPAAIDRLGEPADPGLAKDARDLELPPWNKGRYGTAIGRAVHGVLQTINLVTGAGLADAVAAQALAEGVAADAELVASLARAALTSSTVRRAAAGRHWRETYVGTVIGDRVLEGFVDLIYRDDDGLVIVDYKTDAAPVAALDARVAFYKPQLAAYAAALSAAVSEPVTRGVLVFLSPTAATDREVDDLATAIPAATAAAVAR